MESIINQSLISALLLLIVIISGFWLRKQGEPYKVFLFTVHKLAIVALTVFIVLIYNNHFELFEFRGTGLILFISSGIFYLIAFVSGALLSFKNIVKFKWKWIHLLSSILTFLLGLAIWWVCH